MDEWILSYEVGAKKPKQKIYDMIFEKKNVERSEVLYIDDIPNYVEAAQGFGIQGIVFKDAKDVWELIRKNSI
jgi:HAD superfamily hydrolase (TIGR01509 family)